MDNKDKSRPRLVKWQKLREVEMTSKEAEGSPYWNWVEQKKTGHEADWEPELAAPTRENYGALDEDLYEATLEALKTLTPQERQAIELLAQGESYASAAEIMDISRGTLQGYVKRGQKKVRDFALQTRDISGECGEDH